MRVEGEGHGDDMGGGSTTYLARLLPPSLARMRASRARKQTQTGLAHPNRRPARLAVPKGPAPWTSTLTIGRPPPRTNEARNQSPTLHAIFRPCSTCGISAMRAPSVAGEDARRGCSAPTRPQRSRTPAHSPRKGEVAVDTRMAAPQQALSKSPCCCTCLLVARR